MSQIRSSGSELTAGRAAVRRRGGPLSRLARFLREVVAELGKVIWPTRTDLITYTAVVMVFLVIMIALVAGMDLGFAKLVVWAFG